MNLPDKFCERMREMLGEEYDEFIKSYDKKINQGIRLNTLKCGDVSELKLDVISGVEWCREGFYADKVKISGNHPYHCAGLFYFQEPSAMSAAVGLPLCENPHILDLCAAPGGKTTQIAARMKNSGVVVSNEIVPKRAAVLAENVERMGLSNTVVTNESPQRLAEKFPLYFDGIIVDAPCSGEGMFRKEPQAVTEWSEAHTLSCGMRQKNILDDAYKMLKSGGYIMYSTCTFAQAENEDVVRYMVEKYDMQICEIPELSMLSDGIGMFPEIEKCRRVFPHKNDGEGHFAALLRKTEKTETASEKRKRNKKALLPEGAIKLYREFERKSLNVKLDGSFVLFGDTLYLLPEEMELDGIKVVRCGLKLGEVKKKRFEPSHALSHALGVELYKNTADFPADSNEISKYMHGETIDGVTDDGWCVISADGYALGWGKAAGGTIKNHYPKYLRTLK